MSAFSLAAVILAAGRSSRMGRPKLLLPWAETSALGHLIRQWHRLRATQIAVVCALEDLPLLAELDRLGFPNDCRVYNPALDDSMFGSIHCAARAPAWSQSLTHWAIILGDQPHLPFDTLHRLLEFAAARPCQVSQPARHGHGRHPVILPRAYFARLALSTATTLRQFLEGLDGGISLLEVDDERFDLDLDRPADYEKALQLDSAEQPLKKVATNEVGADVGRFSKGI